VFNTQLVCTQAISQNKIHNIQDIQKRGTNVSTSTVLILRTAEEKTNIRVILPFTETNYGHSLLSRSAVLQQYCYRLKILEGIVDSSPLTLLKSCMLLRRSAEKCCPRQVLGPRRCLQEPFLFDLDALFTVRMLQHR
jgi:hypothetical protein